MLPSRTTAKNPMIVRQPQGWSQGGGVAAGAERSARCSTSGTDRTIAITTAETHTSSELITARWTARRQCPDQMVGGEAAFSRRPYVRPVALSTRATSGERERQEDDPRYGGEPPPSGTARHRAGEPGPVGQRPTSATKAALKSSWTSPCLT